MLRRHMRSVQCEDEDMMQNRLIDMQYYGILKTVRERPEIMLSDIRTAMDNKRIIPEKIHDLAVWGLIFETVRPRNNRKTYVLSPAGADILDAMDSLYNTIVSKMETGELVIEE
jgi:hypothetical protein